MRKESKNRSWLQGPKVSNVGLTPLSIAFLFLTMTFVSKAQAQEEKYEKVTFTIPWGDGFGRLPVITKQGKRADGTLMTVHEGTENFKVDNEGNVYFIYSFEENSKTRMGVKAFDPSGKEIGAWEAPTKQFTVLRKLAISGEKVYVLADFENEILEFDNKLNPLKQLVIPRPYKAEPTDFFGEGIIHQPLSKDSNDPKQRYVFDKDDWEKNGKPDFLNNQSRNYFTNVIQEGSKTNWSIFNGTSGKVRIDVYQRGNSSTEQIKLFSLEQDVKLKAADTYRLDLSRLVGTDLDGNFFIRLVVSPYHLDSKTLVDRLIKASPNGEILYQMDIPFTEWTPCPLEVDKAGDIYSFWKYDDGCKVFEWKKSKN